MKVEETQAGSWLAASGLRLSEWFERWFPDAFALAIVAVIIVYMACVGIGNSPVQTAQWFGAGFWDLVTFTFQMSMILCSQFAMMFDHGPSVAILAFVANSALLE